MDRTIPATCARFVVSTPMPRRISDRIMRAAELSDLLVELFGIQTADADSIAMEALTGAGWTFGK